MNFFKHGYFTRCGAFSNFVRKNRSTNIKELLQRLYFQKYGRFMVIMKKIDV